MNIIQESRVFFVRNEELLLFKKDDEYSGDDVNIEDYTKEKFLRYVGVKRYEDAIKIVYYFFSKVSDQYITQSGIWTSFEKIRYYPAKPLTSAALMHYITEGRFDNIIRVGVKSGDRVKFTEITE